jgi:hypothetical protein
MTSERCEAYLQRLQRQLRKHGLLHARIVDEAREHLLDAIEDGVRRGLSVEAAEREACSRFGRTDELSAEFGQVYRWDYLLWYLAKIAASVVASIAVALSIEVIVNLRVELQAEALRLAPGFSRTAAMAVAVVLALATAWEIGRKPFDGRRAIFATGAYAAICLVVQALFAQGIEAFGSATFLVGLGYVCSRLERRPSKLTATFGTFVVAIVAIHRIAHVVLDPMRAAVASAVLIAVWTSTITILSRGDRVFSSLFTAQE